MLTFDFTGKYNQLESQRYELYFKTIFLILHVFCKSSTAYWLKICFQLNLMGQFYETIEKKEVKHELII